MLTWLQPTSDKYKKPEDHAVTDNQLRIEKNIEPDHGVTIINTDVKGEKIIRKGTPMQDDRMSTAQYDKYVSAHGFTNRTKVESTGDPFGGTSMLTPAPQESIEDTSSIQKAFESPTSTPGPRKSVIVSRQSMYFNRRNSQLSKGAMHYHKEMFGGKKPGTKVTMTSEMRIQE